jgi:hypothetical protein
MGRVSWARSEERTLVRLKTAVAAAAEYLKN